MYSNPVPGPQPNAIHIHPRYSPQTGRQHDLALMFFKEIVDYTFPTVCISDSPLPPPSARLQVVSTK